jgi:hypothetical protein
MESRPKRPSTSAPDARSGEDVALGAIAFRLVVHLGLMAGQTERPGPRDIADGGRWRLVAPRPATTQVRLPGVGREGGLFVAIPAADVRLMMRGVAAGTVGLGSTEGEATGVTARAFQAIVFGVLEREESTRLVECTDANIHRAWDPGFDRLDFAPLVAVGAVAGQGLRVVTGATIPQSSHHGTAMGSLTAVAGLAFHDLVLPMPECQIQRRRPAGKRMTLEATRLRHPHAGGMTRRAVGAAARDHRVMGVVAPHAVAEHPGRQAPMVGCQELGPLVATHARAGRTGLGGRPLRHQVVAGGAYGAVRLSGRHGLVQTESGR